MPQLTRITAYGTVMFELVSLVSSLGSHLAHSSSGVIAEVHCVSRVYHGIEWPPLRGHEGHLSPPGIAQRFASAEKHVHMVLAVEARESSNTRDKLGAPPLRVHDGRLSSTWYRWRGCCHI